MATKQYGLVHLQTSDAQPLNRVEQTLKSSASKITKQKKLIREAVEEDPSVFQYDEVYDHMKEKQKKTIDEKPKYIPNILKQTNKRKLCYERRIERKIQRERDAEKDKFNDKESFISMSYLKKQEELESAEREEEGEKLIEEKYTEAYRNDFFKSLFNQRFSKIDKPKCIKTESKETIIQKKKLQKIEALLAKKTIGEKYEEAIQHYYRRKANYGINLS